MAPRLEWVFAPTVSEGRLVYRYRNVGADAATTVGENVTVLVEPNQTQWFATKGLAADGEQETHVPLGADLQDGAYDVTVRLVCYAGESEAGSLESTVHVEVRGEQLVPPGAELHTAPVYFAHAREFTVEDDRVVIRYDVEGNVGADGVNAIVYLMHGESSAWHATEAARGPADVLTIGLPVDLVDGTDGWALRLFLFAFAERYPEVDTAQTYWLPIGRNESGRVVPTGPATYQPDSI